MTPGSGGTGKELSDPIDEELGTEAPLAEGGDGGTPDLPLPEPRSQPDAADAADAADAVSYTHLTLPTIYSV